MFITQRRIVAIVWVMVVFVLGGGGEEMFLPPVLICNVFQNVSLLHFKANTFSGLLEGLRYRD